VKKVRLQDFSWQEIDEMNCENITILIPWGSTEQQGSHLPLGVDSIVAERIAVDVAQKTNALVGPLIPLGYSAWFMEYAGTITLRLESLINLARDYYESLLKHGFRKMLVINGHGGNSAVLESLAREWKLRDDTDIAIVDVWKIANNFAKQSESLKEKEFKHGGEAMTSIVMAIDPPVVTLQRAVAEYLKSTKPGFKRKSTMGAVDFEGIEINVFEKAKRCTDSGIMGDPLNANSESGKWLLDSIDHYVERVVLSL
jgi:creatinine amidohydrolase